MPRYSRDSLWRVSLFIVFGWPLAPPPLTAQTSAPPGLIGSWRGENGDAYYFDGSRTVTVPNVPGLDIPNGSPWTLEAWVFPTSPQEQHIAGKRGPCGSGDGFYQLAIGRDTPGKGMGVAQKYVPVDSWTQVVIAMDGHTGWSVYANGALVNTVPAPHWKTRNSGRFAIGGSGTCARFKGIIGEVSLYGRALSAAEVQASVAAGRSGPGTPLAITECENEQCAAGKIGGNVATWTFEGPRGVAVWPQSNTAATLVVERFDPGVGGGVVIHRTNIPGSAAQGLRAVYTGTVSGDEINGEVIWTGGASTQGAERGSWHASIGPAQAQKELAAAQRKQLASLAASGAAPPPAAGKPPAQSSAAAPNGATPAWYQALVKLANDAIRPDANPVDAAHSGGGPEPAKPEFIADRVFTYDLGGTWRLTYPASSTHHPLIDVDVVSKGADFQLIVGVPNIFYPLGESMFNGRYVDARKIRGDLMDAPAHRGSGYRGYAWSKADIEIVDSNNLTLGDITLKRLGGELGANKSCDAAKYANMPNAAAPMFIYATRDFGLGNYGNGACWLYISAHQGHHEAARELALLLHNGSGVQKDLALSFLWLKKSAGEGNKAAQRLLADYYRLGIGVAADPALAQAALAKANDGSAEPPLPETQEQKEAALVGWFANDACEEPARLREDRATRVEKYEYRVDGVALRSHGDAEDRARADEADAQFLCDSLHAYHPPPMPTSH
jgi:hypothetical protein